MDKPMCKDCAYWGGNNQKVIDNVGNSVCLKLKKMAHACQHCTNNFTPRKEGIK